MAKERVFNFKTVLLIDDNEIDNLINLKMIEATAFAENVILFTGALGALDFLKNLMKPNGISKENIPDVIFLDINMPLLDGFQFLEEFERFNDEIKKKIKIVMVSSSTSPIDMKRSVQNPYVSQYVNKPLSAKLLEGIATSIS